MKIAIQDCDYEEALAHEFLDGKKAWQIIRDRALKKCAARLVKENRAKAEALRLKAEGMDTKTIAGRAAWLAQHDELDRLRTQFNKLIEIAYPKSETPR